MKLLLLSQDLMIGAHVEGAARQNGLTVVSLGNQKAVLEAASDESSRVLFIDLKLPGLDVTNFVSKIRAVSSLPIAACGPHVHEAKLTAAREAGCDAVVTRGQFDRYAEQILAKLLQQNER